MNENHFLFLRESFELCRAAMDSGNPPFGAVLVSEGKAVARAFNTTVSDRDATRHAEMNLLDSILGKVPEEVLKRSTLYASNEPCAMCSGAIYWSGIRSVVYGASRDALTSIRQFGLNVGCRDILGTGSERVEVTGPLLEEAVLPMYRQYYAKSALSAKS